MKARLPKNMGGSPTNMNQIAQQAQKMQAEVERVAAELEQKVYTATSGGNAVNISMTGKFEVQDLVISPEVADPDDVEMLADLVKAAVSEVIRKINDEKEERLTNATDGMSLPGLF